MKVELIDSAGGDLSIVNSARVSFDKESEYVIAVGESPKLSAKDEKLVNYLAKHKHMTPFRHNHIQLRCSAPLFLARQLMKHQAGLTWNEVSRRYVDDEPSFYCPSHWRSRPAASIKQGSGDVHEANEEVKIQYDLLCNHSLKVYNNMLEMGVAPEMARMVLPQSMMVDFIWTGNLLAFAHVYNLRSGEGAQEEAKVFAELLKKAIAPAFPIGWNALVHKSV
jgi:thymidylate synthase (FAD)